MTKPKTSKSLDDLIKAARCYGERYTPSDAEWQGASKAQRDAMTWPASVLNKIRRECA